MLPIQSRPSMDHQGRCLPWCDFCLWKVRRIQRGREVSVFAFFFCFFHLRLHQSQVCWLLFVDLFLYMFDHFGFLRLKLFLFFGSNLLLVQALRLFSLRQSFSAAPENGTYAAAIRACDVAERIIAHVLIVIQFLQLDMRKVNQCR